MRKLAAICVPALILAIPSPVRAETSDAEVAACIERNAPRPDSVRGVRITRRDPRAGTKDIIVLKMFGREVPGSGHQLVVRFTEPEDVRGASLLLMQEKETTAVYMATPDLPKPQRIRSADRGAVLFGTDISFEDLEWLEGFRVPQTSNRRKDSKVGLREVYVVESKPEDSSYSKVISYVDKKTCLPLTLELFGSNGRMRKVVTTDPRSHIRHGDAWVAHDMLVRDVRDLTSTHFMVDTHQQDVLTPDGLFSVEGLKQAVLQNPDVRP